MELINTKQTQIVVTSQKRTSRTDSSQALQLQERYPTLKYQFEKFVTVYGQNFPVKYSMRVSDISVAHQGETPTLAAINQVYGNVEQCSNTVQTNAKHSSNTVRTKDEQNEQNKIKETKVNTLLTESDNKEHSLTPTLELLEVDFLREKCLTAPIWFEDAKRLLKLEGGTLFGLIGQFTDFLKARGENFKQESDFKKHFISWALIEIKKNHGTNQYKTDSDRRDIAKKNLTHRFVTGATIAGEISNSEIPV